MLDSLLFQVQPSDPAVLVTMGVALGGVAVLVSWIPARRAAAIDPATVLRQE